MTSIWVQWSAHSHVLQQAVCVRMHNSDTSRECYEQALGDAGTTSLLVCTDTNSTVSATTSTVGTPGLVA